MIVITGIIKLESENELARVKEALIRRAIRSRADAGNIDYVFAQSLEDPTEIRLTEKWEDEATLNAHLKIPDEEFGVIITTAKIERAVVVSSEVSSERELLNR
ncbi:MAG: quinol monooxygenase YgiN [Gammaproteobacteria bacterium]|jgi:quinol monooxygenase YgiN